MSFFKPLEVKLLNFVHYFYYDFWNIYGDPRVRSYIFMEGGPWAVLGMIFTYLFVVKSLGPNLMKFRKPLELKKVILIYNINLVLINGWFFYNGLWVTNFGTDTWKCNSVDKNSKDPADLFKIKLGWLFLITKLIDFCDTFFFVLRKKTKQISGLHVFHHSVMPFFCWLGLKFTPGGNSAFFPLINSGVHTFMYSYYTLSIFPSLKPHLWWKKYITQMQMIQFIAVIVHSVYSMFSPGCNWPKIFIYLSISNAVIFLFMFYSFFNHNYNSRKSNLNNLNKSAKHFHAFLKLKDTKKQ